MKLLKKTITVLLAIVVLILLVSAINHQYQLSKEESLYVANGQFVKVNGYQLHLYTIGQGEQTLVFMAGGGTSSPVLDFKSLYSLLSDQYRIVVIEKVGYGFSDVVNVKRDIDAILSDTRIALSKSSIEGPFVLVPHSMSGLEALYWAQEYPDEVKAIIGLDMSVPESYDTYNVNMPMLTLASWTARIGITRWISNLSESDAIRNGTLTEHEKEVVRAVFYRKTATQPMLNEAQMVKENASKINKSDILEVPLLIFSSNGENTGWNQEDWKLFHQNFINHMPYAQLIDLDCAHYVHNFEYETIALNIQQFIAELD